MVQLAISAVPTRAVFIEQLGGGAGEVKVLADMQVFLDAFSVHLDNINAFYSANSLDG